MPKNQFITNDLTLSFDWYNDKHDKSIKHGWTNNLQDINNLEHVEKKSFGETIN